MRLFKEEEKVQRAKFYPRIIPLAKRSLGKFHGRSAFKHGMVQQYNPFCVTRLRGAQGNVFKGRRIRYLVILFTPSEKGKKS